MSIGDYLSRLGLVLPLVLLLAGAVLYAIKRGWLRTPMVTAGSGRLRLVASLGLAPGVRLVAVDCDGQRLLFTVARGSVTPVPLSPTVSV